MAGYITPLTAGIPNSPPQHTPNATIFQNSIPTRRTVLVEFHQVRDRQVRTRYACGGADLNRHDYPDARKQRGATHSYDCQVSSNSKGTKESFESQVSSAGYIFKAKNL